MHSGLLKLNALPRQLLLVCEPARIALSCVAPCAAPWSPPLLQEECPPDYFLSVQYNFIDQYPLKRMQKYILALSTHRIFEKMNILGDARVVVGGLLLMGQLVHWGEEGNWVPWREQGQ